MDFEAVFRRLYPTLFRYLQRLTGDADWAEDVAQESFVRLLRQRLPEAEARPWLFTVATNLVRDGVRKTTRRQRLLASAGPPASSIPGPEEERERRAEIAAVRAALEGLAPRDRQMLLMREEGFKYAEIARATGVAPGSVGTLVARALRRFAEAYRSQRASDIRTAAQDTAFSAKQG